ncbi:hypothetical protein [Ekhidna sp.]|uniref:hypothetical protein n=1 Tax=Ekhidna sp. TaxID=2608089 RepID=UPI003298C17F
MRKFVYAFALLSFSLASAQVNEKVLTDTVEFITIKVKALESLNYGQNIYRLNYEDCNLEYERSFKSEEGKWLIYDFWLADIDEEKMSLEFDEGGWKMTLVSTGDKIEFDSNNGSGWVSEVHMYSADQAPLVEIGRALYYAIKSCKGFDRFK